MSLAKNAWQIERDDSQVLLSRGGRKRFDVFAISLFPFCARGWLAHQIRQDMWRALQSLKGFSPIVEVSNCDDGLRVKAGGQLSNTFPLKVTQERILTLLSCPRNRARWVQSAGGLI